MSDGKTHDTVGLAVGGGIALIPLLFSTGDLTFTANQVDFLLLGGFEALGTLFLSPDLDGYPWRSVCLQRWDYLGLGWYWSFYGKCIPHRDKLSHSPILGTTLRLLYLSLPFALFLHFSHSLQAQIADWLSYPQNLQHLGMALIGIELSANVHYFLDGLWYRWVTNLLGVKKKRKRVIRRRRA